MRESFQWILFYTSTTDILRTLTFPVFVLWFLFILGMLLVKFNIKLDSVVPFHNAESREYSHFSF